MSKDDSKENKPKIPIDILKEFVSHKMSSEDKRKDYKVVDHFLWKNGEIERHRINVWMVKHVEGYFCDRNYIGYSWFVHFHNYSKTIVDKTIIEEKSDGKKHYY